MKVFLDSSFLIYMNTMTTDERRGLDELFGRLLEETLFTDMLVVDEVLYVCRRKYELPYGVTLGFLREIVLPYTEIIPIGEEDARPFEKYLLKYDLRPSDTIHLAVMEKAGANQIVTEDEDFDRVEEVKRVWLDTL